MKFSSLSEIMQDIVIDRFKSLVNFLNSSKEPYILNYVSYVPGLDILHIAGDFKRTKRKHYYYAAISFPDTSDMVASIKPESYEAFMSYNEGINTIVLYANTYSLHLANHLDTNNNIIYINNKFDAYRLTGLVENR